MLALWRDPLLNAVSHCGDTTYPIIVYCKLDELQRKPQFYLWSVGLPTFVFITASHASLLQTDMELSDRLGVTLTLLLTVVAMQFLITKPAISYLTYLDMYINVALFFMFAMILENVLATTYISNDHVEQFDTIFGLVSISLWIAMHVHIIYWYTTMATIPEAEMKTPTSYTKTLLLKDTLQW